MLDRNGDSQATPVVSPPQFQVEKITMGISVMGFKIENSMPVSSLATDSDSRAGKQCWLFLGMSPRATKCEGLEPCVSTHEAQPPRAMWPPREAPGFELRELIARLSVFWNLCLFVTVKTFSGRLLSPRN